MGIIIGDRPCKSFSVIGEDLEKLRLAKEKKNGCLWRWKDTFFSIKILDVSYLVRTESKPMWSKWWQNLKEKLDWKWTFCKNICESEAGYNFLPFPAQLSFLFFVSLFKWKRENIFHTRSKQRGRQQFYDNWAIHFLQVQWKFIFVTTQLHVGGCTWSHR